MTPLRQTTVVHLEKIIDHLKDAIEQEVRSDNFLAVQTLSVYAENIRQYTRNAAEDDAQTASQGLREIARAVPPVNRPYEMEQSARSLR